MSKKISVFGWRWPSAKRDAAMKEADKVVNLLSTGMDGYYLDPDVASILGTDGSAHR